MLRNIGFSILDALSLPQPAAIEKVDGAFYCAKTILHRRPAFLR